MTVNHDRITLVAKSNDLSINWKCTICFYQHTKNTRLQSWNQSSSMHHNYTHKLPHSIVASVEGTSMEKGWLGETRDAKEVSYLSNCLSSTGWSGRTRNISTMWPVESRSDGVSAQHLSIRWNILLLQPRIWLKSCDGGAGLLPCCIATMTLKSFVISWKGYVPENI